MPLLHAIATLAMTDEALRDKLKAYRANQTQKARAMTLPPEV
ncbi:5-(carboxyamino)imidazole ribonucleotide mutase [Oligella ureolytica]